MEFGSVSPGELGQIDFTLPPDHPGTPCVLGNHRIKKTPEVYVGCAKWGRPEWVGTIYPEGTKEKDFLPVYARNFNAIELNATFYKLPRPQQTEEWKSKVGNGFRFCPKFNNKITHIKRLKDASDLTSIYLEGIEAFGPNLGPAFLQTPPNFATKNLDTLTAYIESLPEWLNTFVELRHPGWYEKADFFEEASSALESVNGGLVITDVAGRRDCMHMRLTSPMAFIRFVGNGLHSTDYTRIDHWVQRISQWISSGIHQVYFFMHQNDELHSPVLARYAIRELNKHCHTNIPEPVFVKDVDAPARPS